MACISLNYHEELWGTIGDKEDLFCFERCCSSNLEDFLRSTQGAMDGFKLGFKGTLSTYSI